MSDVVAEIFDLFARFGAEDYGEGLSLERHMIQTAVLALGFGASNSIVAAALLHDLGHFLDPRADGAAANGIDLEHEALGALWLSRAFGRDVTAPIALHVRAKRYLCAVQPGYFDGLSAASRTSLAVQGGPLTPTEAAAFEREPGFEGAVLLRRCDDLGKDAHRITPDLESFRSLLAACRQGRSPAALPPAQKAFP
jgi:predicted HD phosphohydrolase